MIHPSQLESRYGGEAENLTSYWPPQYRSNEFGHNPDLINCSQSEYLIEEKEEIKFEMIPQTKEDKVMQEILNSEVCKEEIENGIPQRRFTETTEEKNKANAFFDEMIVQRQASKISHFECF